MFGVLKVFSEKIFLYKRCHKALETFTNTGILKKKQPWAFKLKPKQKIKFIYKFKQTISEDTLYYIFALSPIKVTANIY